MTSRPRRCVLVEGKDDQAAITALMKRHSVDFGQAPDFDPVVLSGNGLPGLLTLLNTAKMTYDRLAIVVDADRDARDAWRAICNHFPELTFPAAPPHGGFVGEHARPAGRMGIWVMPDNANEGMLETFLARLVPASDPTWGFAMEAVGKAKTLGAPFGTTAKARLRTWLAWQDPEGLPFGTAIRSRTLPHDSPLANEFAAWFRRVLIDD